MENWTPIIIFNNCSAPIVNRARFCFDLKFFWSVSYERWTLSDELAYVVIRNQFLLFFSLRAANRELTLRKRTVMAQSIQFHFFRIWADAMHFDWRSLLMTFEPVRITMVNVMHWEQNIWNTQTEANVIRLKTENYSPFIITRFRE